MHQLNKFQHYLFYLFCFVLFGILLFKSSVGIDTDFGWHIRLAEYISTRGLPQTEPFTYTMSNNAYIDQEWLYHVVLWVLYSIGGYFGLAFVFSIVAFIPQLYLWRKYTTEGVLCILLLFSVFILRMGIRPEVMTWMLFFVFFVFLQSSRLYRRYLLFLPAYFLLWVNLHGSYILPIFLLGIFLAIRLVHKQVTKKELVVYLVCILITLINPYGYALWFETISHVAQPLVKNSVMEWGRAYTYPEPAHAMLVVLLCLFGYRYRSRFTTEEKIISILLLVLSISSIRLVPVFVLWAVLLLPRGLGYFREEISRVPLAHKRYSVFLSILIGVAFLFFIIESASSVRNAMYLREEAYYPKNAVQELRKMNVSGNIFSLYTWGGYLNWKYPERKVFIDGRVSSFQLLHNEGSSAYEDYLSIMRGQRIDELFSSYDIKTVLIRAEDSGDGSLKPSFNETSQEAVVTFLEEKGWVIVYEDTVARIYVNRTSYGN